MSKTVDLLKSIDDPETGKEILESILLAKLGEALIVDKDLIKLPAGLPDANESKLEKIHVSPRKNPNGNVIMWDPKEGKYYNQSTDTYLSLAELKKYGLMESYHEEKRRDLVAEATLDFIDAIQCGRTNEAMTLVRGIMETRLAEIAMYPSEDDPNAEWVEYDGEDDAFDIPDQYCTDDDEYDDDEDDDEYEDDEYDYSYDDDEIEEAKIITKVNSLGVKRRRLQCRPGYELSNGVCVPVGGTKKINKLRSAKRAARTKRAMGSGYALKVARKTKKAMIKRKSFGLHELYLNEAMDTRTSIAHVLKVMGFGAIRVPQAEYNTNDEFWVLDVVLTPAEMVSMGKELIKIDKRRFGSVKVSALGKTTKVVVPLHSTMHESVTSMTKHGDDKYLYVVDGVDYLIVKDKDFWKIDDQQGYGAELQNRKVKKSFTTESDSLPNDTVPWKDARFPTPELAGDAIFDLVG